MTLAHMTASRTHFNLTAIMRRAHHEARFALHLSKARGGTVAARRAIFANFLVKAWAAAKAEAVALAAQVRQAVQIRTALAERARQSVALVASYGAEGVRQAIASETMRDRMNFAAIAKLEAALVGVGA